MDYLLGADSSTQKLVVMVVAILLFVGVMALVLFVAELLSSRLRRRLL